MFYSLLRYSVFIFIALGLFTISQAQYQHGPTLAAHVAFTECIPVSMAKRDWHHHDQSLIEKNTSLVCNKVEFLDNDNNNFFYKHIDIPRGSSISGTRYITYVDKDPGMKDWIRTQSIDEFCDGIIDICSGWLQSKVGIETVVQNYVPFTFGQAINNPEQRVLYMHEGYGEYNFDVFSDIIHDPNMSKAEKIDQLKNMRVYGKLYVLGDQLNHALEKKVPYKIQGGMYNYSFSTIDLIFSDLEDITVYATRDYNTYEINTGKTVVTAVEVGISIYFAVKTIQLANRAKNKIVKIIGFNASDPNISFPNNWPSWWTNNQPVAIRDVSDSIFDIIQKALSGDMNSQNVLRTEALKCDEGTSQYNTKVCDILTMLVAQNGITQSNALHNNDTLIVSENLLSEQGLINAMLAETSARYIAYQNSENGNLLVYLFTPNRNEHHVNTHRQLNPFLEGYSFVGAGYIEVFDQSATFDSGSMYNEYGYDRPSDPSVQRQILERISHLFKQFYGS